MGFSAAVFEKLQSITDKDGVTRAPEELLCYSYDATGRSFLPDVVVFPSNTNQVSRIVSLADQASIPVIPRGSGSGMTGGALPVKGGIVMVMSRMNRILEIDTKTFTARVEPGVITGDLHRAVEEKGLFYPPDPASSSFCTLGGNIAECAGGPRALKYGVTRDYVLGLEAVLPSGQVIHTGVRTAKGVAGYDLTRLIVGSEGTLAVVTQMVLRLLPLPQQVGTLCVVFDAMTQAAKTVSAIIAESVLPRCIEYMDRASIGCVQDHFARALPETDLDSIGAVLLVEVDGTAASVSEDLSKLEAFCMAKGAMDVVVAKTKTDAADLWKARKALSPAMFNLAPDKINEDIVVPINLIPDMVQRLESLQKRTGLFMVSFGHAGDGNIHCNILYDKRDAKQRQLAKKTVDELFEFTLELGGTITGEHGIGITKMKYLSWEIGESEIELMKQIKTVFDPKALLNPGKIF